MPKLGLPNVTCVKLNWKFKIVNAINDCVAYRCSHLRGSIRNYLTQLPLIT